ncbi:MBL fold metallo-hydrolase [Sphingomonas crusticola]|uniref:MBL fold metallo-hydrolase n=1 Tax=Sphingomonas crusticola TaxID=1697973 RepID=UPI000E2872CB|nr:MBL fold metallo-hydrolase [Sphingomonas crusticola]
MVRCLPFLFWAAAGFASAAAAQSPAVQQPAAPPPAVQPQTIKAIAPGFYMVTGAGGNVTVWTADHGLILVDDKLAGEANFNNLVAAIRTVSDLPVIAVFNTHHHGDHVGNNGRFIDAHVMVIGNDGLAERLAAQAAGGTAPASPNILFSKDFSLVLTRGRVDAHHYIPGHTSGDTVVYFPTGRIVAAGDLLNGGTPTIDYGGGANIAGWIATLDEMLKLDFELAVPGHGDHPMRRPDVLAFRAKMQTFLDRARAAVGAGTGEAQLIARIKVDDLGWSWSPTAWPQARLDGLWAEAGGRTPK